jgi:hypothetical protein
MVDPAIYFFENMPTIILGINGRIHTSSLLKTGIHSPGKLVCLGLKFINMNGYIAIDTIKKIFNLWVIKIAIKGES